MEQFCNSYCYCFWFLIYCLIHLEIVSVLISDCYICLVCFWFWFWIRVMFTSFLFSLQLLFRFLFLDFFGVGWTALVPLPLSRFERNGTMLWFAE
jgi:hypothetical protein